MDMQFPAINGGVVTEAIARYCAVNGHAKHTVDGVDTGSCPRCGEVTIPANVQMCPHGYGIDPTDECPWCTGEETVEEMTQTGDATNETREVFPRVTFRDVEDAEMVAESLRGSVITLGKKAAEVVKIYNTSLALRNVGIPATLMHNDTNQPADVKKLLPEYIAGILRMLGMMEACAAELTKLYAPTAENGKYVTQMLEFVTETRDYAEALEMLINSLEKSGER